MYDSSKQSGYQSGYIDIFNPQFILEKRKIYSKKTIPFIVDVDCINIGSSTDLLMAEKIITKFNFDWLIISIKYP